MACTDLEAAILRAALRAPGGLLLHFEAQGAEAAYLLVAGQHIDLEDPEALGRLVRRGWLAPGMGRELVLTAPGRKAARDLA